MTCFGLLLVSFVTISFVIAAAAYRGTTSTPFALE